MKQRLKTLKALGTSDGESSSGHSEPDRRDYRTEPMIDNIAYRDIPPEWAAASS